VAARAGVEHHAAAQGVGRRDRAHDDVVAGAGEQRALEAQLPQAGAERGEPARRLAGAVVDVDARAVLGVRAQREGRVEDAAGPDDARGGDHVAAADGAALEAGEVTDAAIAESEAQRAMIWKIREDYPDCSRRDSPSVGTDTSVPVSAVPDFVNTAERELKARWPEGRMAAIGHAGDGNIHVSLHAPADWPGDRAAWAERADGMEPLVNAIAVSLGGSFSAEHGIGQSKRHAMATHKNPVALELMRNIKQAIDPDGRMNPGKVLP
jgi:FAD/FMN-containing dehydrogenase